MERKATKQWNEIKNLHIFREIMVMGRKSHANQTVVMC